MNSTLRTKHGGFTLVELLVAVLISSIGLLGLVGLEAMAILDTQTSRMRALVALQASSLAAAMHGNRAFWTFNVAPVGFGTTGVTVNDNTGLLSTPGNSCLFTYLPGSNRCTPANLAAYDVQRWATNLNRLVPNYTSSVACSSVTTAPYSCVLNIVWTERFITRGTAPENDSLATGGLRTFSLYIEP